jgi:prophage regulatory protein
MLKAILESRRETDLETYLSDIQVAARYAVNRSTPWRWVKSEPGFPAPVTLSPGCTRWQLSKLLEWEASKEKAATHLPTKA